MLVEHLKALLLRGLRNWPRMPVFPGAIPLAAAPGTTLTRERLLSRPSARRRDHARADRNSRLGVQVGAEYPAR
jgi:hypothetical protein